MNDDQKRNIVYVHGYAEATPHQLEMVEANKKLDALQVELMKREYGDLLGDENK